MDQPTPIQPTQPTQPKGFFANVPSKFTFIFGLVIGIAAFSIFGYISLLTRVSGTSVAKANTNANTNGAVAGDTAAANTNTAAAAEPVKPVSDSDHYEGKKDAAVSIVVYTDFECPYCKTFHDTAKQLLASYPNDVKLIYRNYPLSFHANAQKEAEASECAAKIGGNDAYWKYVNAIFDRTTSNGTGFALTSLVPLAKEIGLKEKDFQTCLDGDQTKSIVTTDQSEGSSAGVSGTPTGFVLDKTGKQVGSVPGAVPLTTLEASVKQALGT